MVPPSGELPDAFEVVARRTGATVHLELCGELDLATAPQLQAAIDDAIAAGARQVVLDLRAVEFIDSTGLKVIYRLDQCARRDGINAAIVRGAPHVQRLFVIAGIEERFVFLDASDELSPPSPS